MSIIIVDPIMTEADLVCARNALEMLKDAEHGSEEETKRSRIAGMIREYEARGRGAVREAGKTSTAWASDHRRTIGGIASGLASLAALGFGLLRWRKAREHRSAADRMLAGVQNAPARIAGAGRSGWKAARNRATSLMK